MDDFEAQDKKEEEFIVKTFFTEQPKKPDGPYRLWDDPGFWLALFIGTLGFFILRKGICEQEVPDFLIGSIFSVSVWLFVLWRNRGKKKSFLLGFILWLLLTFFSLVLASPPNFYSGCM